MKQRRVQMKASRMRRDVGRGCLKKVLSMETSGEKESMG